jgi:2-keto-4-pentenoate hydratase
MTPNDEQAQAAARALLEARRSKRPRTSVAAEFGLNDLTAAYATQIALVRQRDQQGERLAGYKLGVTAPEMQAKLSLSGPLRGVLFASAEHHNGVTLRHADFIAPRLEVEVAMRFSQDLVSPVVDMQEMIDALAGVMPALEICDSAFDGWPKTLPDAVADNLSFGAHVLGDPVSVQLLEQFSTDATLRLNGKEMATGNTSNCMGNPLNACLWLVNRLRAEGQVIRAGDVIMTGTLTGMTPVAAGDQVEVDMGPLGKLRCRFN